MKKAEYKFANYEFSDERILFIRLQPGIEIDLEMSKEMQRASMEITGSEKFVALVDARVQVVVTKEAREWGSSAEAQVNMLAQAVLVNSLANKMVGNFIIKFHQPPARTKLFSDEESALTWLRKQKAEFGLS